MVALESLLQHIQFRLATRKFCIVSERELERAWPPGEKRAEAIQEFAKAHNLSAAINNSGTRVRFKKLPVP
jgi:ERCC4-type nuclease